MKVAVAWHPNYRKCFQFSSDDEFFLYRHRENGWFGDDGTLFDTYTAPVVVGGLMQEGYEVNVEPSVLGWMECMYSEFVTTPSLRESFKPFRFQVFGERYLWDEPTGLSVWSTGTGKTVVGVMAAARSIDLGFVDHVVVWAPTHLLKGWDDNFAKFSTLDVSRMDKGTTARRVKAYGQSESVVWLINYEKVRCNDYEAIVEALQGKSVLFIFDEMAKLKSRKSALHKNMKTLIKDLRVEFMKGLTATPIEKSPVDYYNLFRVLKPELYGTVKDFERNYTYDCGQQDRYWNYLGFQNLQDMRFRSASMVSIARKSTPEIAAEFPEKQEIVVPLELSVEDSRLYGDLIEMARRRVREEDAARPLFADAARRCCSLPETLLLMSDPEIVELASRHKHVAESRGSAKLNTTIDLIDSIISEGEKVLVFYHLVEHGLLPLAERLKAFKPLLFHGGMSTNEKDTAVNDFRTSAKRQLFLLSDAGREGLQLPEAGYVIHYDTPYLWSHYEQRSNRVHRIDSDRQSVSIYRFMTGGTIEERIEEIMFERKAYAEDIGAADQSVYGSDQHDDKYLLFGNGG